MGTETARPDTEMRPVLAPFLICLATGAPYNAVDTPPHPARLHTGSVQCRTEYTTVWDTQYQEKETQECVTDYEKVCHTVNERLCKATTRQECQTVYEKSCKTVYKSVCVDQYKTEYEPYTETECTTQYKEDCEYQWEGYGNNKVWAPIPGTCKQNPYDRSSHSGRLCSTSPSCSAPSACSSWTVTLRTFSLRSITLSTVPW